MSSLLTNKRLLVAILGVILVLLGVGSWRLIDSGVQRILMYKSPYTFQMQPGPASQPLAERLILVIIEGLESGSAENMLTVRDIADRGVAVSLQGSRGLAPIPASTVLMTGTSPEISGVITNWFSDKVIIDSLWSSASRAGLSTVIVGDAKWKPLFGNLVTRGIYREEDDKLSNTCINDTILKDAIIEIEQGKSELMLVSFHPERRLARSLVETRHDITREEAEANIDRRLDDLLEAVDLSSSVVIVVLGSPPLTQNMLAGLPANTGNTLLVAAGAGIVTPEGPPETIQWVSGRSVDVAPTCASLLGISIPTHSQGEVIFSVLEMPHHILSETAIRQTDARVEFATQYMNTVGRQANTDWSQIDAFLLHNDGNYQRAYEVARGTDKEIISALKDTRSAMVSSSRLVSIPVFVVVVGLLICFMTILLRGNLKRVSVAVAGILCYFATYYALLLIRGMPLSSSAILSPSDLTGFYHGRIVDSVVSMAFTAVLVGWLLSGGRERPKRGQGFFSGLISYCFIAIALIAQIGIFTMTEGFSYDLYLPDMQKGFRCFMYLIQLMVAGILLPISAGLSEGVFVLASQLGPSRSGHRRRLSK